MKRSLDNLKQKLFALYFDLWGSLLYCFKFLTKLFVTLIFRKLFCDSEIDFGVFQVWSADCYNGA